MRKFFTVGVVPSWTRGAIYAARDPDSVNSLALLQPTGPVLAIGQHQVYTISGTTEG
jgi:hypothetical protein